MFALLALAVAFSSSPFFVSVSDALPVAVLSPLPPKEMQKLPADEQKCVTLVFIVNEGFNNPRIRELAKGLCKEKDQKDILLNNGWCEIDQAKLKEFMLLVNKQNGTTQTPPMIPEGGRVFGKHAPPNGIWLALYAPKCELATVKAAVKASVKSDKNAA